MIRHLAVLLCLLAFSLSIQACESDATWRDRIGAAEAALPDPFNQCSGASAISDIKDCLTSNGNERIDGPEYEHATAAWRGYVNCYPSRRAILEHEVALLENRTGHYCRAVAALKAALPASSTFHKLPAELSNSAYHCAASIQDPIRREEYFETVGRLLQSTTPPYRVVDPATRGQILGDWRDMFSIGAARRTITDIAANIVALQSCDSFWGEFLLQAKAHIRGFDPRFSCAMDNAKIRSQLELISWKL